MYVAHLELRDFRSWKELTLDMEPGITVFTGRNGFGKTNIVESLGYMAHLSSHRSSLDSALIRAGAPHARISAVIRKESRELRAHMLIQQGKHNLAQLNRTRLDSPRGLLGVLKTVLFAPEDLSLVRGEPAVRRKFLDLLISTRIPRMAAVRAEYDHVVRQRTALLKSAYRSLKQGYNSADGASALSTLDIWDGKLAALGAQIIAARCALLSILNEHVERAYTLIDSQSRPASVRYKSTLPLLAECDEESRCDPRIVEAGLLAALGAHREQDIDRGLCLVGPHRDDLELFLGNQPAKGFASHGETWSFALALRLAEFTILRADGTDPILILDDVFAELDAYRRERLVALIHDVEQVLITAAIGADFPDNLRHSITAIHTVTMHECSEESAQSQRMSFLDESTKPHEH